MILKQQTADAILETIEQLRKSAEFRYKANLIKGERWLIKK